MIVQFRLVKATIFCAFPSSLMRITVKRENLIYATEKWPLSAVHGVEKLFDFAEAQGKE